MASRNSGDVRYWQLELSVGAEAPRAFGFTRSERKADALAASLALALQQAMSPRNLRGRGVEIVVVITAQEFIRNVEGGIVDLDEP